MGKSTKNRYSKIFRFIASCFSTPTKSMITAWLFWLVLWINPLFHYIIPLNIHAALLIAACIGFFSFGDKFIGFSIKKTKVTKDKIKSFKLPNTKKLNRIVKILAVLGLLGCIAFVLSRLLFYGLDYSQGLSSARFQQQQQTLGEARTPPITTLIGLSLYSCSSAAFLVVCFSNEINKLTRKLAIISLVSPVLVTVMSGGRGGIYNLLIIIFSATLVRYYSGQKFDFSSIKAFKSKKINIKRILVFAFILFSFYVFYIFSDRAQVRAQNDFQENLTKLEVFKDVKPAKYLTDLAQEGYVNGDLVVNSLSTYSYLTQGPFLLTRLFDSNVQIGPYLGQYQVPLVSIVFRKYFPNLDTTEDIKADKSTAQLYGGGMTAWGSMYLDFGVMGAFIEAFLYGCITRLVFFYAIRRNQLGDKVLMAFLMQTIIQSTYTAPLAGGGSIYTFIIFVLLKGPLNRASAGKFKYKNITPITQSQNV